jgi:hypothetical protein
MVSKGVATQAKTKACHVTCQCACWELLGSWYSASNHYEKSVFTRKATQQACGRGLLAEVPPPLSVLLTVAQTRRKNIAETFCTILRRVLRQS